MTPEQFRKAKEAFHAAMGRPAEERASFVEAASAGDPEVKAEVESLLAAAADAGGFLEDARLPALPRTDALEAPDSPGPATGRPRIGPYTILREIGRGGMGSVFLAERSDREYRGQVALKLVKRGMDTEFILARFRAERQILASLSHPNIARLLDGGTTHDGLPYFVMEYIEGQHLTEYCAERRLGLRERIELFRTISAAVQFAHRNLVVHRDIKPSNLLVTPDGVPKLLDFGLAKVLDPERSGESFYQTVAGVGIFTPEYASPEQVRGEAVTTSTDVYSLGVVLYELLAGTHPYRRADAGHAELVQAILETEPRPPSQAAAANPGRANALAGDLDTIVLTALRKEPERRYATVEKLSADLRRHLEGLPVSARPDTFFYRTGKFVRRNRVAAAAAFLVLLSLIGGLSASLWQARVARREKAIAEKRFNEVRKLAGMVLFELHDAIKPLPGSTPARALLVTTALDYLNRLAADAGRDQQLLREIAAAYERVGDVQGGVAQGNLGDTQGAMSSYRKALALREALAKEPRATAPDRQALAEALQRMSDALSRSGDHPAALAEARRALGLCEELFGASPADPAAKRNLAHALQIEGEALEETGDTAGALASYRRETRLFEELLLADPQNSAAKGKVLVGHHQIGEALLASGDANGAVPELRLAAEISDELVRREPANSDFQRYAAFAEMNYGLALTRAGSTGPGLAALGRSRELFEGILRADPQNANIRMFLGSLYSAFGRALADSGRRAEGAALQRRGLEALEKVVREDPGNATARRERDRAEERLAGSDRGGADPGNPSGGSRSPSSGAVP